MGAEHFCSIVAVSIPFLLFEILIIERLGFLFRTFPKFIFVMLWRLKIPRDVLVVSPWFQADYRLVWKWNERFCRPDFKSLIKLLLKVYEFFFFTKWLLESTCLKWLFGQWTSLHYFVVRLCLQCLRRWLFSLVIMHWGFYVQCVLVLTRNTFFWTTMFLNIVVYIWA